MAGLIAKGNRLYKAESSSSFLGLDVCGTGIPNSTARSYVFFLSQAHFTVFQQGVVTRKNSASRSRWRENATTVSSLVGNNTQPFIRCGVPLSITFPQASFPCC